MDAPLRPRPASTVEKIFIQLNGARQGMFISGADEQRPVLLYLHGGMPDFFLDRKYRSGLDELFTVVWWEQRGSGISYRRRAPGDIITVEQLIDDTLAMSQHLRRRFGRDRVYLMGHSGGTFIGLQAAARAPELYDAYIGVAQITDQLESEILAWRFMVDESERRGLHRLARRLRRCEVTRERGATAEYMRVRDVAMHALGVGTMHSMRSVITGIFLESLRCREYTLAERARLWIAKAHSGASVVWDAMMKTDLGTLVPELRVPVYLLHGVHDYTCSYTLAREYFARLAAPMKGFYTFEHSAHSPIFEEPERTRFIVREDILHGTVSLADDATSRETRERPGPVVT